MTAINTGRIAATTPTHPVAAILESDFAAKIAAAKVCCRRETIF
jgi:hypothetical protein